MATCAMWADEVLSDPRGIGKRNRERRSRLGCEGDKSSARKTSVSDEGSEARRASGMKMTVGYNLLALALSSSGG